METENIIKIFKKKLPILGIPLEVVIDGGKESIK